MKKIIFVLLTATAFVIQVEAKWHNALTPSGKGITVELVKNGKANYKIIANGNDKAADFLRSGLKVLTGMDFSGNAPFSISLNKSGKNLGVDGYSIEVKDDNITLRGENGNGIFNAVTALLEEDLGWRFYQKYQGTVSPGGKITAAKIVPRTCKPPFYQRMLYSKWAFDKDWAEANKMRMGNFNRKYLVHTMTLRFVTRKEFFKDHPEYFAIHSGHRNSHRSGQLCMTNPEVRKIVAQRAIQVIKENPGIEFLSISQGDNDDYCECPECRKLLKKEGAPSGPLLHFINAVATEVGKVYPDVIITTLAYRYTMDAPKHVKPVKNVMVRFMTFNRINTYPYDFIADTPDMKILNDWTRITDHRLLVWDHMTNFRHYLLPRADLPVLEKNIRLFKDKKVFGVMLLTNYHTELGTQAAMRTWVCMKLLWNPDWDIKKLSEDYINGFFGPKVAPFMLQYNNLLIDEWKQYHAANKPGSPFRFSENLYPEASTLLKKALAAAAGSPLLTKELELEELTLDYYLLEKGITRKSDIPLYRKTIDHFVKQLNKYKINMIVEGEVNGVQKKINTYQDGIRLVKYLDTLPDRRIVLPATWSCYANHKNRKKLGIDLINDRDSLVGRSLMQSPDDKWYVQWRLVDFTQFGPGKYKVRIRLRADKKYSKGAGATVGVQNRLTNQVIMRRVVKAGELDNSKFTWIDCGSFTNNSEPMLLYTSAAKNGPFKALYVDAVELIPEKN